MSKLSRRLLVLFATLPLALYISGPAPAAEMPAPNLILDLNKDLKPDDPRFQCGGIQCPYHPADFGPFHISYARADFGSGRLEYLNLQLKAPEADVRAWLVGLLGEPSKTIDKETIWNPYDGGWVDLTPGDGKTYLSLSFRDAPPVIIACPGEDYDKAFEHPDPVEPKVEVAVADESGDDEEHC